MLPSAKDIHVIIVDGGNAMTCGAGCGPDWSSAGVVGQARQQINARFGDHVHLKYLDLSKSGGETPGMPPAVTDREAQLPLLLINGEIRISGQFDIRMLLDAIDVETEMNR